MPIFDLENPIQRHTLEMFAGYMNCGFLICSNKSDYDIDFINNRFPQYLGYTHSEYISKYSRFIDCIHPHDRKYVQKTIAQVLEKSDEYELIFRVLSKSGATVWIRENGARIITAEGDELLMCVLMNISEDMETRREIELQSKTDPLTGILNRAAFIEQIEKLLNEKARNMRYHAFIMMDVDHFKTINDTFGRVFGDHVLQDIAAGIRGLIREGDMFGRLGGDEFMLCLKDIKTDAFVEKRANQICEAVHKVLPDGVNLSCSFGIAFYPQNGCDFETLYRCADMALFSAKRSGRDCFVVYSPNIDETGFTPNNTPIDNND